MVEKVRELVKMKKILGLVIVLVLLVVGVVPVVAAYGYTTAFTVTETAGSTRTLIPVLVDLNNQNLVTYGYLGSDGLDTRMQEAETDRPYSVISNRLGFVVPSLSSYGAKELLYYTTYDPDASDFDVVVGTPGGSISVADCDDLELGNTFEVEIKGYIETTHSDYVNRNLVFKDAAFKICISAEGSIQAVITGGATVTASSIDSDDMVVLVKADSINLEIYVDDMETPVHSQPIGAAVTDNGNGWVLAQNDAMLSIEYVKFRTG